jgi:hypothetical protein
MATYVQGSATTQQDFLDQLRIFLEANGWTTDRFDVPTKDFSTHLGTVYVQFLWTNAANIAIFHSLGFDGFAGPGGHTDDSGNGDNVVPIDTQRRLSDIGAGPFENHWFFFNPTTATVHAVLEFLPGLYRHCSFGTVTKFGTWTGGEFCSGHVVVVANKANVFDTGHSLALDSRNTDDSHSCATVHCEGLPGENVLSKWGVVWAGADGSTANDRGGEPRVNLLGGVREGFLPNSLGWLKANPSNGFIPLMPIRLWQRSSVASPKTFRLLGSMPDAKLINIANVTPQEEFVAGGFTWKCFPWSRKNVQAQIDAGEEGSGNRGIAYKKV